MTGVAGAWQPGSSAPPGVMGGDACIVRTRIPVWLLESYRRLGWSEARILESFPALRADDLVNAWAYRNAHGEEIDQAIRDQDSGLVPLARPRALLTEPEAESDWPSGSEQVSSSQTCSLPLGRSLALPVRSERALDQSVDFGPSATDSAACAAASRAMGTRNGEHDT